jgi:hypothetical protein
MTCTSTDDGSSVLNDRTPLMRSASSSSSSSSSSPPSHHRHPRKHSHTLGETVIVAMSNYSCDEGGEDDDDGVGSAEGGETHHHHHHHHHHRMSVVDRWAPVQDDGTEPLVIFHPHHAVHPHHPGGPSLLRLSSDDVPAATACVRRHSSSIDDDGGGGSMPPPPPPPPPPSTGTGRATSDDDGCEIAIREGRGTTGDYIATSHLLPPSRGGKPNSWGEACQANAREFWEHWRDFFNGIYSSGRNRVDANNDNSLWDVIALTVELPFTIARKVGLSFFLSSVRVVYPF